MLTKEQRNELFTEWVAALRSGKYEQAKQTLHRIYESPLASSNYRHAYCCLGVLCEISVKHGYLQQLDPLNNEYAYPYEADYGMKYSCALTSELELFKDFIGMTEETEGKLIELNDGNGIKDPELKSVSFDVIADWIEFNLLPPKEPQQ